MKTLPARKKIEYFIAFCTLIGLFIFWSWKGLAETGVSADVARDLTQISNLWIHRVVWLGPNLGIGFPISPLYFYLLFPGLILSGGNGYSIVITESFFALIALGLFAWFQIKKSFSSTLLGILVIGLSPWWVSASSSPWNGNMYASWILMAIVSMWFKMPFFLSALLLGIATSIHPMAILVLPLLIYEWIVKDKKLINLFFAILGFIIPWSPIIIFEIITKGYLTRQWLAHPSTTGVHLMLNLSNVSQIAQQFGFGLIVGIILWIATFWVASKRQKWWIISLTISLFIVMLLSNLLHYYLYGLVCAVLFIIINVFSTKRIGQISLALFIILSLLSIRIPFATPDRTISKLNTVVKKTIKDFPLDKNKKYAVLSISDNGSTLPQADDYRFFLRVQGYKVLGSEEYTNAELLLLFIETPKMKWETWQDWNMEQFGAKKRVSARNINGTTVVLYEKK